jgi:ferredoxin
VNNDSKSDVSEFEMNGVIDWRDYFSGEEIDNAYDKIQNGEDPNDQEVMSRASESCPSDDNLSLKELNQIFTFSKNNGMKEENDDNPKSKTPTIVDKQVSPLKQ